MLSQVATGPSEGGGGEFGRTNAAAIVMSSAKVTQAMLALVAKLCILASTYALRRQTPAPTKSDQQRQGRCL